MWKKILAASVLILATVSSAFGSDLQSQRIALAEQYIRGIYGGDPSVVDNLTSDDIVVSYPIFQSVLGTPALRGHDAVRAFVERFGKRWADPRLEIHETICEGSRVVLLWSFYARSVAPTQSQEAASKEETLWGGITLIRFDDEGKISAEIGEESDPGPYQRVNSSHED